MIRRAVRDVSVPSSPEVEPDIVDRRVGVHNRAGERVRSKVRAVHVEADELGTTGHLRVEVGAVDAWTTGVESPDAVQAVHDDGLNEDELVGRNAIPWVRNVLKRRGSIPFLATEGVS